MNTPNPFTDLFDGADVISVYTRAEALADGSLVDVSALASEVGFRLPVAVTRAVWVMIERIPDTLRGIEDERGRLWDVLWMAKNAAVRAADTADLVGFTVTLNRVEGGKRINRTPLKMVISGDDEGEPVITVMLPDEN